MKKFYLSMFPIIIKENVNETHIHMHDSYDICNDSEETYRDNTGRLLWKDILNHIKSNIDTELMIDSGVDHNYSEKNTYIWFHIKFDEKKTITKTNEIILDLLEKFYDQEIRPNLMTKLVRMIQEKLNRPNRYFADALSVYQHMKGKEKTQEFIEFFFEDVQKRDLYRYDK